MKQNCWIDSLDLAKIALPRLTSHRLLDLVRAFGGPDSTHRADDDVAATCLVYRVLLAAVDTMPTPLLQHIADMCDSDTWNTERVFKCLAAMKESEGPYSLRASRKAAVAQASAPLRPDVNVPDSSPVGKELPPAGSEAPSFLSQPMRKFLKPFPLRVYWALCTRNMSRAKNSAKWPLR